MKHEIPTTHKQLVQRVTHWLRFSKKCNVVAAELSTQCAETPDAIGWHGSGYSILVECKMSRADFHADKNKRFRHFEDEGMGDERFFAAPPGILKEEDIPDGWGLIVVHAYRLEVVKTPTLKKTNKRSEVKMLMSILRRLEISTAVFVQQEEAP